MVCSPPPSAGCEGPPLISCAHCRAHSRPHTFAPGFIANLGIDHLSAPTRIFHDETREDYGLIGDELQQRRKEFPSAFPLRSAWAWVTLLELDFPDWKSRLCARLKLDGNGSAWFVAQSNTDLNLNRVGSLWKSWGIEREGIKNDGAGR